MLVFLSILAFRNTLKMNMINDYNYNKYRVTGSCDPIHEIQQWALKGFRIGLGLIVHSFKLPSSLYE